jgi:hypothetical protein
MAKHSRLIDTSVETGETKTFAAALDWPGWARSGRGEAAALQTLADYAPRYARVLKGTTLTFPARVDVTALKVVGRVKGNTATDFGALNVPLDHDDAPVNADELARWQAILSACWDTFDAAVEAAQGKTLRKGPRGGGRDLLRIGEHIRDVNNSYLSNLGGKVKLSKPGEAFDTLPPIREAILATLIAAVNGELPSVGPRGGKRWTPRYFVRRLAWHELDHTWEIEDRIE